MVTVCPSQFATRRTLFHVLVGCGLLMLKVSRLKLPVIWLDRKSGSAGMPRPISYAVFCLKKKKKPKEKRTALHENVTNTAISKQTVHTRGDERPTSFTQMTDTT